MLFVMMMREMTDVGVPGVMKGVLIADHLAHIIGKVGQVLITVVLVALCMIDMMVQLMRGVVVLIMSTTAADHQFGGRELEASYVNGLMSIILITTSLENQ